MIERIEHINTDLKIWRIVLTPVEGFEGARDAEELRQTQVQLRQPWPLTGIARHSRRPVIGDRVTVVVQPCGDVKWVAAPEHQHQASPKAVRQFQCACKNKSVSLVEIRPTQFRPQVIVVSGEREWTTRVVSRARQGVARHAFQPLAYTAAESHA